MKLYYDFHIHSGLSPCGDNEMTPNNIVNMAKLYDLDVIAFDRGITYEDCLTMYPRDGFRIVVDLAMVKDLKIEAIK